MRTLALILSVFALGASPCAAAAPDQGPILTYYPTAALARHVDGSATLSCERTEHAGFTHCRLISETPSGQGFGDAALSIASKTVEPCDVTLPSDRRGPQPLTITFHAEPPSIQPNLLRPGWAIEEPRWLRRPSAEEFADRYPAAALRAGLGGHAAMRCRVGNDGGMTDCELVEEAPAGAQFGAALLRMAPLFKLTTRTCDGRSTAGASVMIPVRFEPPR